MDYPEHLIKYIPTSFDLKKYENARDMDLNSWYKNLGSRRICFLSNSLHEKKAYVQIDINNFLQNGALIHKDVLGNRFKDKDKLDEHYRGDQGSRIVRTLTLRDVVGHIEDCTSKPGFKEFRALNDSWDELNFEQRHNLTSVALYDQLRTFKPHSFSNKLDGSEWIEVDFLNTDSEIESAFKDWLKIKRKEFKARAKYPAKRKEPIIPLFNKDKMRGWYTGKVLPYIDLVIWNKMEGRIIPNAVLGAVLFPEILSREAKINDIVKPLVEKLMENGTLIRMCSVVNEIERKKRIRKIS